MYQPVDIIIQQFLFTYDVLKAQTADLSHADSLRQLPFRGNCLNWILGHLIVSRGRLLLMLGEPPLWSKEEAAPYGRGSAPITAENADQACSLEKLRADLDASQVRVLAALQKINPADLEKPVGDQTLFYWLSRLAFHEAYHAGQTEQLRQLAGKDDAVFI
ncbi:MAG: DinB family protein [Anaerolineae bacterium]|jgi:hypothetical protein|nr:DinB family protein [Anaerolineae bacterium]